MLVLNTHSVPDRRWVLPSLRCVPLEVTCTVPILLPHRDTLCAGAPCAQHWGAPSWSRISDQRLLFN